MAFKPHKTTAAACLLAAMLAAPSAQAQTGRNSPMTAFDANGDNQVTLQELEMARVQLFARADLNRDGTLDRGEFSQIQQGRSARRGRTETFETADANYDGKVTKAEFRSGARRMMHSLDRNGDFVLDRRDFMRRKRQ